MGCCVCLPGYCIPAQDFFLRVSFITCERSACLLMQVGVHLVVRGNFDDAKDVCSSTNVVTGKRQCCSFPCQCVRTSRSLKRHV